MERNRGINGAASMLWLALATVMWLPQAADAEFAAVEGIEFSKSAQFYDRQARAYFTLNSALNASGQPLVGAMRLVVENATLPIRNADGNTAGGDPFFTLSSDQQFELPSGVSTAEVRILFERRRIRLSYSLRLEVDAPPPVDDQAPVITLAAPAADSLFNSSPVSVSGSVDDDTATVLINGQPATVAAGGSFNVDNVALREGPNLLTVTATDSAGNSSTASVQVSLDTDPPTVTVETPADGATLTSLQVDVAGLVNDIITGTTIDSQDCQVTVNGVEAQVSNRAWVVPDLLLQRGQNVLEIVATDRAGNRRSLSTEVNVQDQAGQRVILLSGNNQNTVMGEQLQDPLVVTLQDANGDPVADHPVIFEVSRGDGSLGAFPAEGRRLTVNTDDNGLASVLFTPGERIGAANHRVIARATGFIGEVEFCAISTAGVVQRITTIAGDHQVGVISQPLPEPLVILVTDGGGNPVAGVDVVFTVAEGGGSFNNNASTTRSTDNDGLASIQWNLGAVEGSSNNIAFANFVGLTESSAIFTASGRQSGPAADTTVSGVVLDNQDNPIAGATVHLEQEDVVLDPLPTAVTDEQGRFSIANVPVGTLHLVADGSTSNREGRWPAVSTELTTIAGRDNDIGQPIWIPQLADNEFLVETGGPEQDITLSMPGIDGTELTVFAHSVTCPNGAAQ